MRRQPDPRREWIPRHAGRTAIHHRNRAAQLPDRGRHRRIDTNQLILYRPGESGIAAAAIGPECGRLRRQPGGAVGDDQQRRAQAALVELVEESRPRRRCNGNVDGATWRLYSSEDGVSATGAVAEWGRKPSPHWPAPTPHLFPHTAVRLPERNATARAGRGTLF